MDHNNYIVFADGSSEVCSFFSHPSDLNRLYIVLDGADLSKAAEVLGNPEKLQTMTYCGETITGYTHIDYIELLDYGVRVSLSPTR